MVFICVLSTQLQTVADQITSVLKERLNEQGVRNLIAAAPPDASPSDVEHSPKLYAYRCAPLVYSFVACDSARKLSQLLGFYHLALIARLAPSRGALRTRRAARELCRLRIRRLLAYQFCATRLLVPAAEACL